jgi:hypothetical protein
MPKRLLSLALAAILASVLSALPARADCCDDFWSCVATIATGGLSCKAQQIAAAIEGTKKLIAAVEATRTGFSKVSDDAVEKTRSDVDSAGDSMTGDLQKSLDDIKKSANEMEIVTRKKTMQLAPFAGPAGAGAVAMAPAGAPGPSGAIAPTGAAAQGSAAFKGSAATASRNTVAGGGASSPAAEGGGSSASLPYSAVADPARVQADLKRALEWVQAAQNDAETKQAPVVRTKANEARQEFQKSEPVARKMVGDQLLNPLDAVKAQLDHVLATILNPLDFTSVTKYVDAQIKLIQGRAPGTFDGMSKKLVSGAESQLMAGRQPLDDVKKQAGDTKKVTNAAKALAESGKKSDLDKLEALIGPPPSDQAMVAPGTSLANTARAPASSSVASGAFLKTQGTAKAARLRAQDLSAGLASQWDAARKLLPAGPVAITPAMQKKVADDLSKRFAGKSFPDARKTQEQLLDEARVKFASDPKTLAAVERYLHAQTSSLLAASSAPIKR